VTTRRVPTLVFGLVGLAAVALSFVTQWAVLLAVAAGIGFIHVTRIPWRFVLGAGVVVLGAAALAPAAQVPGAQDPLAVSAYTLAVLGCGAGLVEAFAERRSAAAAGTAAGPEDQASEDRGSLDG
jgi:hypothetical protein